MRSITCLDCGTLIEQDDAPDPLDLKPCPNCGSSRRSVALNAIALVQTSTLSVTGAPPIVGGAGQLGVTGTLEATGPASTAAGTGVVTRPAEDSTAVGVKTTAAGTATHVAELWITPPSEDMDFYWLQVVRGGEVVAIGQGDSLIEGVYKLIEYLLPPDDVAYPGRSDD